MINPQLGIDTWEGQLEIDEAVLKANDVKFMFIRLNSIAGGHHKDDLFDKQWAEAAAFHRAPYFVYNPWVTGQQNFDWLLANIPPDAKAVGIDLEVRKDGYSPITYANEVDKFTILAMKKWNVINYTGEWFLPYLSYWPNYVPYWWAQYPFEFYSPSSPQSMTWGALREKLKGYDYPFNQSKVPGPLLCWQISGDTLILPGNPRIMDLCIFYGDLDAFFGPVSGAPTGGEVITSVPYPGVVQEQGRLNGQKYYLQTINMNGKKARVKSFNGVLRRVEDVARLDNAQIVVNADDYEIGGSYLPKGMSYTDGQQVTPEFDARYWLNISTGNVISYGFGKPPADAYNLTSFIRPMVVNGELHDSLFLDKVENKEIHARSLLGVDANNELMILVCEGFVNPATGAAYAGVTLPQAAQLAKDRGAVFMGEHGGGGDAGLFSLGEMVNESSDRDAGQGWRGIVQVVEIFTGDVMSTTNGIAVEKLGNEAVIRKTPSRYGFVVKRVAPQTPSWQTEFVEKVPVQKEGIADKDGEMWLKLPDGNFVNWKLYSGGVLKDYFSIVQEPVVDQPGGELQPFDVGVMVVREGYRDGFNTVHMEPK